MSRKLPIGGIGSAILDALDGAGGISRDEHGLWKGSTAHTSSPLTLAKLLECVRMLDAARLDREIA